MCLKWENVKNMISWTAWIGFWCLAGLSMVKWPVLLLVFTSKSFFFFVSVWTNHFQGTTDTNKSRDGSQKRQTQVRHIISVLVPLTYCSWCQSWTTFFLKICVFACFPSSDLYFVSYSNFTFLGFIVTLPCQEECEHQLFQLFWKQHMFLHKWKHALVTVVYMMQEMWFGQVIDGPTNHGTLPQEAVHF